MRGVCQECLYSPATFAERLLQKARGKAEKPSRGRRAGTATADSKQDLLNFQRKLLSLKALDRLRSSITANEMASILHIGGATGGDAVMKRINKGLKIRSTFRTLVDLIWDGGSVEIKSSN